MNTRILLVDDDERQATTLRDVLRCYGYSVEVCGNGVDAVELAGSAAFSVILLDWELPDRQGPAVARELRAAGIMAPVIMLTGRSSVPDKVTALRAGADDCLTKPFDFRELEARMEALIRRCLGARPGTMRVGAITVHLRSHEVFVGEARLGLTHLEMRLLILLMDRADDVVNRGEILASLWGVNNAGGSNILDVHIAHLREKLREAGRQIETVRGVGYRMRSAPAIPE